MVLQPEFLLSFSFLLASVCNLGLFASVWSRLLESRVCAASKGRIWASRLAGLCALFLAAYCATIISRSIDVSPLLKHEHITSNCRVNTLGEITALAAGQTSPDIDPSKWTFTLKSSVLFTMAMSYTTKFHDTIEGLIRLCAAAVALAFVMVLKSIFESVQANEKYVNWRASLSSVFVACGLAALVSAQHLLFMIVNGQLIVLSSGRGFCYDNFAAYYVELFLFVIASGLSAVFAVLILPECLRLHFQSRD